MDKRLLTVILIAVVVALVITAVFYQVTVGRRPVQAEVPTKELVVAKKDLPMGSVITAEDVRLVDYPEQAYPAGAFANIEDVVDRSVVNRVLADEPILAGRVTEKGAGVGLAPLIPEGKRAVAIGINQISGVSGFINPGSQVDILLTGNPRGSDERVTTTVLENVTVLTTGHRVEMNANGQPENVPVINLLLTPEETELLTLATSEGSIQLVLRNPMDEEKTAAERTGVYSSDLFSKTRRSRRPATRPRPVRRAAPPPPPAPVVHKIEMIRGNRRSTETIDSGGNQ